jgi:hypothetical protein
MLGGTVVFRVVNGKTILSNRPKKRPITDHQKKIRENFLNAQHYAKLRMKDAASKEEYSKGISDRLTNAYTVALVDALKGPEITSVNTNDYHGRRGDEVAVHAIDNFSVTSVRVEVRSANGELLDSGNAMRQGATAWVFAASETITACPEVQIVVKAKDKPGNEAVKVARCRLHVAKNALQIASSRLQKRTCCRMQEADCRMSAVSSKTHVASAGASAMNITGQAKESTTDKNSGKKRKRVKPGTCNPSSLILRRASLKPATCYLSPFADAHARLSNFSPDGRIDLRDLQVNLDRRGQLIQHIVDNLFGNRLEQVRGPLHFVPDDLEQRLVVDGT